MMFNCRVSNDIYNYDTSLLGAEWGDTSASKYSSELIAPNNVITILLADIQDGNLSNGFNGYNNDDGGIVGYFWPGNNYKAAYQTGTNERIMFVVDAVMFANPDPNGYSSTSTKYVGGTWSPTDYWAEDVFSTLAHEFQHMIQFYQKGIVKRGDGQTADTWINEMCSHLVEDLVAYNLQVPGPRGIAWNDPTAGTSKNGNGRIPYFNSTPLIDSYGNVTGYQSMGYYSLMGESGYPWPDYSFSYAFGSWLMRNYGGADFVKNVVSDPATDSACVTNAVTKATGRSQTMADLLSRWAVSVLGSDRTDMPPGYRYNIGANWVSSTAGSITYNLGSINFFNYKPAPEVLTSTGSVPKVSISKASNVYYQASSTSGLTGSKTWSLVVPQGVGFSVFVTPHTP
jgi:hypothetical protein